MLFAIPYQRAMHQPVHLRRVHARRSRTALALVAISLLCSIACREQTERAPDTVVPRGPIPSAADQAVGANMPTARGVQIPVPRLDKPQAETDAGPGVSPPTPRGVPL